MVSSCFNAGCCVPFRHLRQGKLFAFQITVASHENVRSGRPEWFWLCRQCASRFTLILEETRVRCVRRNDAN